MEAETESNAIAVALERGRRRRATRLLALAGVAFIALASMFSLVLLSPVLLRFVAERYSADWTNLSEVGQTYQAASAILSALALAAVAGSLVFQAKQATGQQIQTVRGLHFELTKMALDEPGLYIPCWRPIDGHSVDEKRQHLYENLVISYMWMSYELTGLREPEIRLLIARLFTGEVPRRYWQTARAGWMPTYMGSLSKRRARRFIEIVDDEFDKADKAGPPSAPSRLEIPDSGESGAGRTGEFERVVPLLGLLGGVAIGAVLGRRSR